MKLVPLSIAFVLGALTSAVCLRFTLVPRSALTAKDAPAIYVSTAQIPAAPGAPLPDATRDGETLPDETTASEPPPLPPPDVPQDGEPLPMEDRQQRLATAIAKLDFLSSIEVDGMGRQERRSHERLQKRIIESEELADALEADDLTREERDEIALRKAQTDAAIEELNVKVRKNLISIVARNLGVDKEDAKVVVETIGEIIKATE